MPPRALEDGRPETLGEQHSWLPQEDVCHRVPETDVGVGPGRDKFILSPCYHVQQLSPQQAMTNPQDTGKTKVVFVIYSSFIFEETSFFYYYKNMYYSHRNLRKNIKRNKKKKKSSLITFSRDNLCKHLEQYLYYPALSSFALFFFS